MADIKGQSLNARSTWGLPGTTQVQLPPLLAQTQAALPWRRSRLSLSTSRPC